MAEPLRVVVAMAPFKGALSAARATTAAAAGMRLLPGVATVETPVADGGEGTLAALVAARGGSVKAFPVRDPLGRHLDAEVGLIPGLAVIELARASGYELLDDEERDPEATGTWGTGQLIRAALDMGAPRIIVGVGGSATNDGGLGLAVALGAKAFDAEGRPLEGRGADLAQVDRLDLSGLDARLADTRIDVACDVTTPFTGPEGATVVFGPQKGASPEALVRLEGGMENLARAMAAATGVDPRTIPGAGAAGGAAGGLASLLGASLVPGAALVLDAVGLAERLEGADLCVTGEGRLDGQTLAGKAPAAVAEACGAAGVPCVALCGEVALGPRAIREAGITSAFAIGRGVRPLPDALAEAERDLAAAGAALASLWLTAATSRHRAG